MGRCGGFRNTSERGIRRSASSPQSPLPVRGGANCQIIDGVLDFDEHPDHTASYFITHDLYDECVPVSAKEADETARLVARTEGLLFGTSGAAALAAAIRLSKDPQLAGKNIVVIIPDGGGKYLSSPLYGI